jgi:hypothetical protein
VTATGVNKVYDGNTSATVTLATDKLAGDYVTVGYTTATFASKDKADGIAVSVSGISITGGAQSGNYTLNGVTTGATTANITARTLVVTATGVNKVYDGNTSATVTLSDNRVSGDAFSASYTNACFLDKNVGTNKTVNVKGISISGGDASNYTLASTTAGTTANISVRALTLTSVTNTKIYDGTTSAAATPSISGLQTGDSVTSLTETYDNKNSGTGKSISVATYTVNDGNSGNNYSVTTQTATGTITAKALTMTGLSVPASKIYDGTTAATVSGTPSLQSAEATGTGTASDGKAYTGDTVNITGTPTGTYNSKDVATATTVSFGGLSLTGTDAADYTLTIQSPAAATITRKALTYSGLSVPTSKVYDATITAAVSGTAALQSTEAAGAGTTSDCKPYNVDSVSLTGTPTGTYNSKDVATAITVTFGGVSLAGTGCGNYTLTVLTQAATITAKALTMTGLSVPASKVYDGTTVATVSGTPALQATETAGTGATSDGKPYTGDLVSIAGTATGNYNSKNVSAASTVTFGGLSLTGGQASDYTLTIQSPASATIAAATLTYTATAVGRVYGAPNPAFSGTVTGFIGTETQASATTGTLAFTTAATSTSAPGSYAINGSGLVANNGNYTFVQALGNATALTVTKASTATALTSSANPACQASSITFTATVTDTSAGSTGTPTGTVTFKDGATTLGSGSLNGSGVATYITSVLVPGAHSITACYATDGNFSASTSAALAQQVNVAPTVTVDLNSQTLQYGCAIGPVTITANDSDSAGTSLVLTSIAYTFNGGSSISGLPPALSLITNATGAHSAAWEVIGNALTTPGTYVITVTVQDQCTAQGTTNFTIVVNPAPAQPAADSYYTGPTFYWTTGPSSSTATLTLMATLRNATCLGDIRTAKASFYVRSGTTLTPITGAQNLPVGLVNAGDTSVGTAAANVQYSIGSASATTLQIAVVVSGNYQSNTNDATTDGMLTIAVPVPGGMICGGGTITNASSAGYLKGYAPDQTCFSFYVQYSKSGSNPQGSVQIFDRSYYKPDGSLDTVLHTYMFKSTSISLLSVTLGTSSTNSVAQFTSKANVTEILPNGTQVSIEGNDVMQLTLSDGTPRVPASTARTLGITIQRTKGGTWYSSSWDGTKTVEKQVSGGTVSVK